MNEAEPDYAIRVRKLGKSFGAQKVLDQVSLEVCSGEVAAILGPSGSGKSTLLRCLNGLEDFQSGELEIAKITLAAELPPSTRADRVAQVRRRVGMVFQQFNLFPHRSALGNVIEAPIYVLGTPRDTAVADAQALLARVGLSDRLEHMPEMLSGGQQQRVAIARALAMKPQIMLFDEPTSALDPQMAGEVEQVILDLAASGQTMVVVTHSLALARRVARTVHILEAGRLIESGPTEQVFARPREEATRRFLSQFTAG